MTSITTGLKRLRLALVLALACAPRAVGWAATETQDQQVTDVSYTVGLDLELINGGKATIKAKDGGRMAITLEDGQSLALTPVVVNGQLDVVLTDLSIMGVETDLSRVTLAQGIPTVLDGVPVVSQVTWTSFTVSKTAPSPASQCESRSLPRMEGATGRLPHPDSPCSFCCISCGGMTYCGCGLVTECGACCCPNGCAC